MKQIIKSITLGLALTASALATSAHAASAVCRAHVPNGTDLIFTIADGPQTGEEGQSLFNGGGGHGTVSVNPVAPLKIQYPTHFAVTSSWSKRWRMQIGAFRTIEGVHFLLQSEGNFDRLSRFAATISYGRPDLKFSARCRLTDVD